LFLQLWDHLCYLQITPFYLPIFATFIFDADLLLIVLVELNDFVETGAWDVLAITGKNGIFLAKGFATWPLWELTEDLALITDDLFEITD